jgi:ABC-type multidrug transport system permease subunit
MVKIWLLFKTEAIRLWKYKILVFGFIVTSIWLLLLAVASEEEAIALLPQLLVFDTGLMTIILLASSFFFEKQEGTLKALFVTPIHLTQLLISKVLSTLIPAFASIFFMTVTMLLFHGILLPLPLALVIVLLSTIAHVAIGYPLIFLSKDFMDLLVKYTFLALFFMLPGILVSLDVIPADFQWLALLSPTYATQYLISGLFSTLDLSFIGFSLLVLLLIPGILFPFAVYPFFKKEVMQG